MTQNVLLTCFGGNVLYEIYNDFRQRSDMELYVADMNSRSKARLLVDNFIQLLPANDPQYLDDLMIKAKEFDIKMIIPGGDEEALRLMPVKYKFEAQGIQVAVQDLAMLPLFASKSAMYDHLKSKGFKVPFYRTFKTLAEFEEVLKEVNYPREPYLVKPNSARGGRGITILSERICSNPDHLALYNRELFVDLIDDKEEFILMEYIEGIVYDIDVLTYASGDVYLGPRKRFTNVTKNFSGNIFDHDPAVIEYSKKLFDILPTQYLLDYDLMVAPDGRIELLEINPRPSGSTVSYIPFGVNLYYILAQSYLNDQHIPVSTSINGQQAVTFHKMVKGAVL